MVTNFVKGMSKRSTMAIVGLAVGMGLALAGSGYAQESKPAEKKDAVKKKPRAVLQALTPERARQSKQQGKQQKIVTDKSEEQLQKEQGPGPKAEFIQPDHDFGEQWVGGKLKHTFEVKNVGEKPLKLLSVKPSCGCTLAGKYDKEIAPGATGKIPVSVDSKKLFGKFKKSIRVSTDDPAKRNVSLSIAGTIKHYVETSPRAANFRNLKPTEEKDVTVKLTNAVEEPLELTLASPKAGSSFTVEVVEKVPGKEFDVVVHAKPPYKEGRLSGLIKLKTNNTKQPELQIRVTGNALARIDIKPKQVIISRPRDKEYTQTITVTNHGNSPVHLLDATVDDDKLILATKEIEPGQRYQVALTMPAGYKPDAAGKKLIIKLDDSEKPVVTVPIRSTTRPPKPAQLLEGKTAPVVEFTTHGGTKINTADIKDELLVLKFYASWCGYCKKSLPNIEKVHQEYKDKGVRFIAMNLDDPNSQRKSKAITPEQSLAKLKELGVTFDVAFDPTKEFSKKFKVSSFPTMFIIDKSSKVVKVEMGAIQGSRIGTFKKQLDGFLRAQSAKAETVPAAATLSSGTE